MPTPAQMERKSSRKVDIAKINNKRKFNVKTIFGSGGSPEGKSRVQNWAPAFSEVSRCWVLKPAHMEGPCRHGNSSCRCWNYPGTMRQVYSQKCSGYRRGRRCALRFCYLSYVRWGTWTPESEVSGWKLFYLDCPDQRCGSPLQGQHGREAFILRTNHLLPISFN